MASYKETQISFRQRESPPLPVRSTLNGILRLYRLSPFLHESGRISGDPLLLCDTTSKLPTSCFLIVEETTAREHVGVKKNLVFPLNTISHASADCYIGTLGFGIYHTEDEDSIVCPYPAFIRIGGYDYPLTAIWCSQEMRLKSSGGRKKFSPVE